MAGSRTLRLHGWLPHSRANGPGVRAVVWVQGCSLGCPGCFNPNTHTPVGGEQITVHALFERLLSLGDSIEGLTLSGGEPLQQPRPLLELLQRVRLETRLSTLLFTGYTLAEIERMPFAAALLDSLDVLIAGRYVQEQRLASGLIGSANKEVRLLTPRYTPADLERIPAAEIFVTPQGDILYSGIDPLLPE